MNSIIFKLLEMRLRIHLKGNLFELFSSMKHTRVNITIFKRDSESQNCFIYN